MEFTRDGKLLLTKAGKTMAFKYRFTAKDTLKLDDENLMRGMTNFMPGADKMTIISLTKDELVASVMGDARTFHRPGSNDGSGGKEDTSNVKEVSDKLVGTWEVTAGRGRGASVHFTRGGSALHGQGWQE